MNHIAQVLRRSTSTVHAWVKSSDYHNNRKLSPAARSNGVKGFYNSIGSLTHRIKLFIMGFYKTWEEAMDATVTSLGLIDYIVANQSENLTPNQEEEPD